MKSDLCSINQYWELKMRMPQKGFTLIELMIVIAIIGILASIAVLQLGQYTARANDKSAQSDVRNIMPIAAKAAVK